MNNKYCKIVQDLLPNYIEGLTSDETNKFIEEHLKECVECKEIYTRMKEEFYKKESDEKVNINFLKKHKKQISKLRITLFIIIIAILILLVNVGRKTYILRKYENANIEYSKCTNYYKKMENEGAISEIWRKDEKILFKRTSESGEQIIYSDQNDTWIIVNEKNPEVKIATRLSEESKIASIGSLASPVLPSNNIWAEIGTAFLSRITTKNVDGVKCYDIYVFPDYIHTLVDKNTLLIKQGINGKYLEYRINNVTDEEVKMPDLTGYEIRNEK